MRNSFKFIGKGATLLAATSLLMAVTAVIPAEAANKAGARCTKANAKTKKELAQANPLLASLMGGSDVTKVSKKSKTTKSKK